MSCALHGNLGSIFLIARTRMLLFLSLFALAAVAFLVLRGLNARGPAVDPAWPLMPKALLTPRERGFYALLEESYPQHRVFVQVALSQLLEVKPGTANGQAIRNHFSQLVADFVLCRADFSVVAIIELDDSSHAATERQNADRRKTKAVESAGLRFVRIPAGELPSNDELRKLIEGNDVEPSPALVVLNSTTETAALLRPLLGVVLVGVAIVGGWLAYSRLIAGISPRITPAARVATTPVPPPLAVAEATAASAAAVQRAEQERLDAARALAAQEAGDALEERKLAAWAAFYQAPASCEHPAAWADQVECGNGYIRAKRAFEKIWQAQSDSSSAEMVKASRAQQ